MMKYVFVYIYNFQFFLSLFPYSFSYLCILSCLSLFFLWLHLLIFFKTMIIPLCYFPLLSPFVLFPVTVACIMTFLCLLLHDFNGIFIALQCQGGILYFSLKSDDSSKYYFRPWLHFMNLFLSILKSNLTASPHPIITSFKKSVYNDYIYNAFVYVTNIQCSIILTFRS